MDVESTIESDQSTAFHNRHHQEFEIWFAVYKEALRHFSIRLSIRFSIPFRGGEYGVNTTQNAFHVQYAYTPEAAASS